MLSVGVPFALAPTAATDTISVMNRREPLHLASFSLTFLVLGLLLAFSAIAQNPPPTEPKAPATLAELRQRLGDLVGQKKFAAAMWGVKIVSLDTGATLFEENPQKLFSPASNSKLYTVALALERLGAEYRIKTSLYAASAPNSSGVLKGDLIVYGRGDPTLNARLHGKDLFQALQPLVDAITNAGIKRIDGDIVGDESYFKGPPMGSGWSWDDLENYYGAELSALTLNDNVFEVVVKPGASVGAPCRLSLLPETSWITFSNRTQTIDKGGLRKLQFYHPVFQNLLYVTGQMPIDSLGTTNDVTVHDPAGLFAAFLREALMRNGVKVKGRARSVNWLDRQVDPVDCDTLVELGHVESPTLREIAREVQKPSQNLYTDLLLAHVGEHFRGTNTLSGDTSEDLGIRELNRFLGELGIKRGQTIFEEGSGLSRNNLTCPNATVTLLRHMNGSKNAKAYIDALPIAGVDGTLRNRMKGTPAAGNVRAKTGTLRWATSLSGYVTTAAGERLVFSLMLNRFYDRQPARGDLDTIAALLAGFTGKSSE